MNTAPAATASLFDDEPAASPIRLGWGTDSRTGELRHAGEVAPGRACLCRCPACGYTLSAVQKGHQRPYFQHETSAATAACAARALLEALKRALPQASSLALPGTAHSAVVLDDQGQEHRFTAKIDAGTYDIITSEFIDDRLICLTLTPGRPLYLVLEIEGAPGQEPPPDVPAARLVFDGDVSIANLDGLIHHIESGTTKLWIRHWQQQDLESAAQQHAQAAADRANARAAMEEEEDGASPLPPHVPRPEIAAPAHQVERVWSSIDDAAAQRAAIHLYAVIWPQLDAGGLIDDAIRCRTHGEPLWPATQRLAEDADAREGVIRDLFTRARLSELRPVRGPYRA